MRSRTVVVVVEVVFLFFTHEECGGPDDELNRTEREKKRERDEMRGMKKTLKSAFGLRKKPISRRYEDEDAPTRKTFVVGVFGDRLGRRVETSKLRKSRRINRGQGCQNVLVYILLDA